MKYTREYLERKSHFKDRSWDDKYDHRKNEYFIKGYEQALAISRVPRWVACKDAMPDKDKEYLCYNGKFVDFYKYRKEWKQFDHDVMGVDTEITHWREVPEPPC